MTDRVEPKSLYGVTKAMFQKYENLRVSGKVNMWDARSYLGWEKEPFIAVIDHYGEMADAWPSVLVKARGG